MMSSPDRSPAHTDKKCGCGKPTAGHDCTECARKRVSKRLHAVSNELASENTTPVINRQKHINHSFSNVNVHAGVRDHQHHVEGSNSFRDDHDPIHSPLVDQFRERESRLSGGLFGIEGAEGPSDGRIIHEGLALSCPATTEVANTIDLRSEALTAGFGTAYGIHSQIRVRPDARTWDGTQISEALTMGANTCPDTLTRGEPCSGSSIFTVGAASGNSAVLSGPRPGAINRFWDFHTTHVRPRSLSVMHDATRNPANLNTCSTVCNQQYSCGGNVIGRHTVTRNYSKGLHNGSNVTFVDITKT